MELESRDKTHELALGQEKAAHASLAREVAVMASLAARPHPHVVSFFGIALQARCVYIVQELCVCSYADVLRGAPLASRQHSAIAQGASPRA